MGNVLCFKSLLYCLLQAGDNMLTLSLDQSFVFADWPHLLPASPPHDEKSHNLDSNTTILCQHLMHLLTAPTYCLGKVFHIANILDFSSHSKLLILALSHRHISINTHRALYIKEHYWNTSLHPVLIKQLGLNSVHSTVSMLILYMSLVQIQHDRQSLWLLMRKIFMCTYSISFVSKCIIIILQVK